MHWLIQCICSRGTQQFVCWRWCFVLLCVPALVELNFIENCYCSLGSQQHCSDMSHWALDPLCPSYLPALLINSVLLWSLSCNQRCSLFCCVFLLFVCLFSEPLSKPALSSPTSQAKKGQNATLSCLSEKGSLPITYTFFKDKRRISQLVKMQKEAAVTFVLINTSSDLGTYKCRAENSFRNSTKYSNSFNFTLAGMHVSNSLLLSIDRDRNKVQNIGRIQVF